LLDENMGFFTSSRTLPIRPFVIRHSHEVEIGPWVDGYDAAGG
jgi:hypothetical protein